MTPQAPRSASRPRTNHVNFRLDEAQIARAARIADAMSEPGLPVTPQDAYRRAIVLGLDLLEAKMLREQRLPPPAPMSPKGK